MRGASASSLRCSSSTSSSCSSSSTSSTHKHPPRRRHVGCRVRAALVQPSQLAAIAAEPVAEVALLAATGAWCARRGLLPPDGRRLISGLVLNVFTPALLFSKLGSSVDVHQAVSLWPLAANMAAAHAAGLALGWLQVVALRLPDGLRAQTVVMSALGNVGNMPLVLIPALLSRPGVLELLRSEGSTPADVAGATSVGVTYVMLGFFVASLIQFPLGYLLLQRPAPAQPAAAAAAAAVAPVGAPVQLAQLQPPALQPPAHQQQPGRAQVIARGVFTPPVIACLLSVPVAAVPELHDALFSPAGSLRVVGDACTLLGQPLIPALFLVLGANLAEGPGKAQAPAPQVVGLLVSKLLLHPLLGLGCCLAALRAGLVPDDTDPLMLLVMLLVWSSPTAVLVHSLATMLQNGEDAVSSLLFWQYVASLASIPLCLAVYLQLLQSGVLAGAGA